MKHIYLYIVCLFALLVQTGCKDEEALSTQEGKRTVTVNLGIAMSRVALEGDPETTYGPADDMKVWIFDEEGNPLAYAEKENPPFSIEDVQGNLVESVTMDFEITGAKTLQLRVLLNTDNVTLDNLTLDKDTKMSEIDDAAFTFNENVTLGDNKIPMYGKEEIKIDDKKNYDIDVEVTRAVGKLELFFTKESANSTLTINSIKLDNVPDKGYLNEEYTPTDIAYTENIDNLIDETLIQTASNADLGNFSKDESNFTKLELSQTYLLENPNGGTWDGEEGDGNRDYTYPESPTQADGYKMTVSYNDKLQEVYLPAIKRNEWNKIFVRVKDGGRLEIKYKAMPWQKVTSEIGYMPKPIPTDDNPFADYTNEDDWEETNIVKDGYYILLPRGSYNDGDRRTTHGLFSYLYERPDNGDDDARYCILTKPTYVDNDHKILKTGSAGARYMFLLTGPKGATWTAHLSNKEEFYFSNSDVNDFNHSIEYESEGSVNMVSHGIARPKPYIIQINVRHSWTGVAADNVEVDESGSVTGEYAWYEDDVYGEHIDDINDDLDDKESWWNEDNRRDEFWAKYDSQDNSLLKDAFSYYTAWGKDMDEKQDLSLISTDFYITVKLADGTEYELTINPPYPYLNNNDKTDTKYKSNRRFAGTDTRIRIRHVPAQYGWSYDDLANDDKNTDGKEWWWKVNSDWK